MSFMDRLTQRLSGRRWEDPLYTPEAKPLSDREAVLAHPERYTRASRRAAGYLKPVWTEHMKAAAKARQGLSRYTRRHVSALLATDTSTRRVRKQRARISRAFARRGIAWQA